MDLSFPRPIAAGDATLSAADMALLVAALATRSEASATALVQASIDHPAETADEAPLAPASGTFNAAMAARLTAWKQA